MRFPSQFAGIAGQAQTGQPVDQRGQDTLRLQARQHCAEAIVNSGAERKMMVWCSAYIEPVGFRKNFRVAVGRSENDCQGVALVNGLTPERDIFQRCEWIGCLGGGVVTKPLLYGRGKEG